MNDLLKTEIGLRIQTVRKNKRLSLQEYAQQLNVSVGYLSDLEQGKKRSVYYHILEELLKEGGFWEDFQSEEDTLKKIVLDWKALNESNPAAARYFLRQFEEGMQLFQNIKKEDILERKID